MGSTHITQEDRDKQLSCPLHRTATLPAQLPYYSAHDPRQLLNEALNFLHQFSQECGTMTLSFKHLTQLQAEIAQTGTYQQDTEALTFGARLAWRNNTRCIGRLHWRNLAVRDLRHLTRAEDIFTALVEHIEFATNKGKIRPLISIFAPQKPGQPGIRIWNPQLIRYAGYLQQDGSILGDPLHVELTEAIKRLGWQPEQQTSFDPLPIVIQMPYEHPRLFHLPRECIMEVPLEHPQYPWFAELGLKWHALPVISNMRLEIGGVSYTAAPFNGWYMGTEIGARNLGDSTRYNLLPRVAKQLGLDMTTDRTLWKDRTLIELNIAVLHSFAQQGVTIVDHHTASRQFVLHQQQEQRAERCVFADWGWIVPPISGSATPVFHIPYENEEVTPNFFAQDMPWLADPHTEQILSIERRASSSP